MWSAQLIGDIRGMVVVGVKVVRAMMGHRHREIHISILSPPNLHLQVFKVGLNHHRLRTPAVNNIIVVELGVEVVSVDFRLLGNRLALVQNFCQVAL